MMGIAIYVYLIENANVSTRGGRIVGAHQRAGLTARIILYTAAVFQMFCWEP